MLHHAEEKLVRLSSVGLGTQSPVKKRGIDLHCVALEPPGPVRKDFKEKTGNSKLELIFVPMGLPR